MMNSRKPSRRELEGKGAKPQVETGAEIGLVRIRIAYWESLSRVEQLFHLAKQNTSDLVLADFQKTLNQMEDQLREDYKQLFIAKESVNDAELTENLKQKQNLYIAHLRLGCAFLRMDEVATNKLITVIQEAKDGASVVIEEQNLQRSIAEAKRKQELDNLMRKLDLEKSLKEQLHAHYLKFSIEDDDYPEELKKLLEEYLIFMDTFYKSEKLAMNGSWFLSEQIRQAKEKAAQTIEETIRLQKQEDEALRQAQEVERQREELLAKERELKKAEEANARVAFIPAKYARRPEKSSGFFCSFAPPMEVADSKVESHSNKLLLQKIEDSEEVVETIKVICESMDETPVSLNLGLKHFIVLKYLPDVGDQSARIDLLTTVHAQIKLIKSDLKASNEKVRDRAYAKLNVLFYAAIALGTIDKNALVFEADNPSNSVYTKARTGLGSLFENLKIRKVDTLKLVNKILTTIDAWKLGSTALTVDPIPYSPSRYKARV